MSEKRERFTERNRPARRIQEDHVDEVVTEPRRNPIVWLAGTSLVASIVLGLVTVVTAEPPPPAPPMPATSQEDMLRDLDLEGFDFGAEDGEGMPFDFGDLDDLGDDLGDEDSDLGDDLGDGEDVGDGNDLGDGEDDGDGDDDTGDDTDGTENDG